MEAGGAERVVSQLANVWAKNTQHDVHIMMIRNPGTKSFYDLDPNITLHHSGNIKFKERHNFSWAWRTLKRLIHMRKLIKKIAPDRLISFSDVMNVTTLLVTKGLKIKGEQLPVIVSERSDPFVYKIPRLFELLRKITYKWAHKIVIQRDNVKGYFSPEVQKLMVTIPNSVPPFSGDLSTTKEPLIVSVGRLDQGKAHHILIKAFAQLAPHYPDWSVEIYGEGVERENLERLIEKLNLHKKILLPGRTQDVPHHLARARLFAFPTLYEGFSNALAEAMAAGLPVVASNCDGNLALVEHNKNGLLFECNQIEEMAAALKELIDSPQKSSQLGQAAQKSVTAFSQENVMEKWDSLLL